MAGTVSLAHAEVGNVRKIIATCVADAADGSFPATELPRIEGRILALATNPGSPAPQSNYDVAVTNQHGYDVLQGLGADRHTSNTEQVAILYTGTGTHPVVDESDTLTLALTNNNVNSAVVVVEIYYALGG